MDLEERLRKLEQQVKDNERTIRKMANRIQKGLHMEDFNFDDLLDDLETEQTQTQASEVTEETPVSTTPEADITAEITEDELLVTEETPETPAPEPVLTQPETAINDVLDALEAENKELKAKIQAMKSLQENMTVEKVVSKYDYSQEAKKFLKEHNDLEMEKRSVIEAQKDLKEQFKDDGVDVAAVLKAQKTMISELKEDAETAQIVEQMKAEIKADENLMTSVTVFAG